MDPPAAAVAVNDHSLAHGGQVIRNVQPRRVRLEMLHDRRAEERDREPCPLHPRSWLPDPLGGGHRRSVTSSDRPG